MPTHKGSRQIWQHDHSSNGTGNSLSTDETDAVTGVRKSSRKKDQGVVCRLFDHDKALSPAACDIFGDTAANVQAACRATRHKESIKSRVGNNPMADGSDLVWLDDLACLGWEAHPEKCPHERNMHRQHDCSHRTEDVGVGWQNGIKIVL